MNFAFFTGIGLMALAIVLFIVSIIYRTTKYNRVTEKVKREYNYSDNEQSMR